MIGSWTDWELTDLGKVHADNIGRKLSAEIKGQAYKIYSSDLMRAKQTAEPLARYMGVDAAYLEKLREHNIGNAVGKSKQWAKENELQVNSFDDQQFAGAESWREFWIRVLDLYRDIIADTAEQIVLVSHGGTLAVWHKVWLGSVVQDCSFGRAGCVSFMELNDKGERFITRINDLSYIDGTTK